MQDIKSEESFLTYVNPIYGFKIEYPSNWQKLEGAMLDKLAPTNEENITVVVGFSPFEAAPVSMFITVSPSENKTASEYMQTQILTLEKDQPNLKLLESNTTTLAGMPAYLLSYKGGIDFEALAQKFGFEGLMGNNQDLGALAEMMGGLGDMQQMSIVTINNGKAYQVAYGGLVDQYSSYLPTAQKMIDSFQMVAAAPTLGENDSSTTTNATVTDERNASSNTQNDEEPLDILKKRLAEGEITIQEFEELRNAISG